jgi:hypothetical protein
MKVGTYKCPSWDRPWPGQIAALSLQTTQESKMGIAIRLTGLA